jgi:hypothetical protein
VQACAHPLLVAVHPCRTPDQNHMHGCQTQAPLAAAGMVVMLSWTCSVSALRCLVQFVGGRQVGAPPAQLCGAALYRLQAVASNFCSAWHWQRSSSGSAFSRWHGCTGQAYRPAWPWPHNTVEQLLQLVAWWVLS